jgi:hypothetical protein
MEPRLSNIDFHSKNYQIKISPMYCDLFSPADTTNWFDSSDTSQAWGENNTGVCIYSKLGPEFSIEVPAKLTLEMIQFNMIDGIIPFENDPDAWLTTRKKCCSWNSTSNIISKVDSGQTETCAYRIQPSDFCHRAPKYNMMYFSAYHSTTGLTSPPELLMSSCVISNIFYEMNSLADFNVGGYVSITDRHYPKNFNLWCSFKKLHP